MKPWLKLALGRKARKALILGVRQLLRDFDRPLNLISVGNPFILVA